MLPGQQKLTKHCRIVLLSLVLGYFILFSFVTPVSAQTSCDPLTQNQIVCENLKPGNPKSEWDISGAGDSSIQGYATEISVNKGESVNFKVKTDATNYRIDIYRLGYYQGLGARKITTISPSAVLPQTQPNCLTDTVTGLIDCGNWVLSASWQTPSDVVSGVYIGKLVREDGTNGSSHIIFIVRDDNSNSNILFQTADTTWQAYNNYGGNSLYIGSPAGRAYKVSYNRPFLTRGDFSGSFGWIFSAEYPMIRFLEANGFDVSYFSGVDSDKRGAEILKHKLFLSVGHDEYWSGQQRTNVEQARNAGVNLGFFSGNEVFWKTRFENSIDGSNSSHKTLVSYKETHANAKIDPTLSWTGTWRDPRFSSDGGKPENSLTGTLFMVNGVRTDSITVSDVYSKLRFWRNTPIANLQSGQTATFPAGTLGYEWDESPDNGFRPAGLFKLSSTTLDVSPKYLLDYGSTYGAGTATHNLVLYKHSSGALVFGAGTVQWSWGLDSTHDNGSNPPDSRMQQATVNLFADMGVFPKSLQGGLVLATASTDTVKPSSQISTPVNNANFDPGVNVTVSGISSDTSGVVAGVEVSTDGGVSWHAAQGISNWQYSFAAPVVAGSLNIKSRAVDDSGNIEIAGEGVTINIVSCNCSSSLSLNGSTSFASIPHDSELNLTGDWTVETWFKDTNTAGSYNHNTTYFLTKGDTDSLSEMPFFLGIEWNRIFAGERTGWSNQTVTASMAGVSFNQWHHLAASMNSTSRVLTLYLDGVWVAQGTLPTQSNVGNTSSVNIGKNGSQHFFKGLLDDLRIWNKVKTIEEINADFRKELSGNEANLVGYWKFNEGAGISSNDSTQPSEIASLQSSASFSLDTPTLNQPSPTPTPSPSPTPSLSPSPSPSPTPPPPPAGAFSLSFDGVTSYAQAAHDPELNVTGDWSVEMWFKDENAAGGFNHNTAYLAIKGDTNVNAEAPFMLGVEWNRLFVGERTGWSNRVATYNLAAAGVNFNAWHHVAATMNSSTSLLTVYLDGVQILQTTLPAHSTVGNSLALSIGRNGTTGHNFKGLIDDVRVWNVVRTASEVSANYQSELASAPSGLVGNWRFNEGAGTSAADNTSPAQNAALTNATWSTDAHP